MDACQLAPQLSVIVSRMHKNASRACPVVPAIFFSTFSPPFQIFAMICREPARDSTRLPFAFGSRLHLQLRQ